MASLDWNYLNKIDPDRLEDEDTEKLFSMIIDANIESENENDKLKSLFHITQAVLQFKAMQAEIAAEELETFAERESTASALREETLRGQIEELRRQLLKQQGFTPSKLKPLSSDLSSREAEQLEEIRYLKKENENLHREMFELDKKFKKEKEEYRKQQQQYEEFEREKRDLRREIGNLTEEIQYYRKQLDEQKEVPNVRQNIDVNSADIIKAKNMQISQLLEQIETLEKSNESLEKNVVEMKLKLEEAAREMESVSVDYSKIKKALQVSDHSLNSLQHENKILNKKFEELSKVHHQKEIIEERALINVNRRIETLQNILQSKDKQIVNLQKQIVDNKKLLQASSDSSALEDISKTLQLKDEQIQLLQQELQQATAELQKNTDIVHNLKMNTSKSNDEIQWKRKLEQQNLLLKQSEENISILKKQLQESEMHALLKDKEFTAAYARLKEYEQGEYGLSEAVAEIKDVRNQLKIRDRQIEDLTQRLNKYELFVNEPAFFNNQRQYEQHYHEALEKSPEMIKDPSNVEKRKLALIHDISRLDTERTRIKEELQQYFKMIEQCCRQLQISPAELNVVYKHIQKSTVDDLHDGRFAISTPKIVFDKEIQTKFEQSSENEEVDASEQSPNAVQGRLLRRYKKLLSFSKNTDNNLKLMQLNTHLLHVLKQLKNKEEHIRLLEEKLETYKTEFPAMLHQTGLLYTEYLKEKEEWSKEKAKLEADHEKLKSDEAVSSVKAKEYESLMEILCKDTEEIKQRIAEMSRQIVILKSTHVILNHNCTKLRHAEVHLKQENHHLQKQLIDFETATLEKLSFMQQAKEAVEYNLSVLQSSLNNSVPKKDFDEVKKDLLNVTLKYHQLLQNHSWTQYQDDQMKDVTNRHQSSIQQELQMEKEKNKSLENILEEISEKEHHSNEKTDSDKHVHCLKENTLLKIKALNEKQRSVTANQLYQCENEIVKHLTKRILDLESKVEELIKINLEQQNKDFELQEYIQDCVGPSVHKSLLEKLQKLEKKQNECCKELNREKTTAEIALHQVHALEGINETLRKEVEALRKERHIDDETKIDNTITVNFKEKLQDNRENISSIPQTEVERIRCQIPKLEAFCLTLQKKCNSKDEDIFNIQNEYRDKIQHLMKIILYLRRQIIGMVPVHKEERLVNRILNLQEENKNLKEEVQNAESKLSFTEEKLYEAQLKISAIEKYNEVMKVGSQVQALYESQQMISELKMNEAKQNRKNELLQLEISHQKLLLQHQENAISLLEEQINELYKTNFLSEWHEDNL